MYSNSIIEIVQQIDDKKYMIKISLNKNIREQIENETKWMNEFYNKLPLKIRCLAIKLGFTEDTIPKCPTCGNPVTYEKEWQKSFATFCSDKCSKTHGRLTEKQKEQLNDKNWLYDLRINKRLSYLDIGTMIGCSELPVRDACIKLDVPMVKMNQSHVDVQAKLADQDWLYREHVENKRTLLDIATEIGSSKATLSRYFQQHGITTNKPNSYDRKNLTRSLEEIEFAEFIESLVPIKVGDRNILDGKEIDVLVPSKNIGFEYNGVFSHLYINPNYPEVVVKEKDYHLDKTKNAAKKGISLFHIFSDDWLYKKDIVKSVVASKLGIYSRKIFARKCSVVTISKPEKNGFLNENHLQGSDQSSIQYALKYNDELVAVMTFNKARYNSTIDWELCRYATLKNTCVVGGFSRLIHAFRKTHTGSITSYADRNISVGDVYIKNGFNKTRESGHSYKYVNISNRSIERKHRAAFMKKRIAPNDPRPEHEVMLEKGWAQIFDCGTITFTID